MKTKRIVLVAISLGFSSLFTNVANAQRSNGENGSARRAEMVGKQAEKLAKDFNLEGDAREAFIATYKNYQEELRGDQRNRGERSNAAQRGDEKKLSNEEATKQVEEYFARQEEQIAQMQQRLEVSKRYYKEFQKTLTPQQLAKIFRQQPMREGNMQRGGNGGPRGGNDGQRPGGFGGPGGMGGFEGGGF